MKTLMSSEDIAAELGCEVQTLRNYLCTQDTVIEGAPIFKLCRCKDRKEKKRCNHPFFMMRDDFTAWIIGKKNQYIGEPAHES